MLNQVFTPPSAIGALLDTDMAAARHCLEVNIFGTLAMCKAVGHRMAERGSGKIVNIGSVVGYVSTPWAGMEPSSILQ